MVRPSGSRRRPKHTATQSASHTPVADAVNPARMPFQQPVTFHTQPDALAPLEARLRNQRAIAVDVEADAMHHFRARLCFVQLATDEEIAVLDTLAPGVSPKTLADVFASPTTTKFFHAAGGDLSYLAEHHVRVQGLFDTHRAATLLGWPKLGLYDLVKEFCGQELKKEHQQADFSLRPLPPELAEYVADDVRYLTAVGRTLWDVAQERDLLEAVLLDCQRLADEAKGQDAAPEFNAKLPKAGQNELEKRRAMALARALHEKRLVWAEQADLPMGRMLSNMAIGAIATEPPTTLRDLSRLSGVRGAFVRQYGEEVLALVRDFIERGRQGTLPEPPPAPARDRKKAKREEALLAWRKDVAQQLQQTPSAVLPNALVEDLASSAPTTLEALAQVPYFGKKRFERHGEAILALLRRLD